MTAWAFQGGERNPIFLMFSEVSAKTFRFSDASNLFGLSDSLY